MKLTWAEKHLTRWLKVIGCTADEAVGILLMADTEQKQYELMDFMAEKPEEVTPQDVLTKLAEILKKKSPVA